MPIISNIKINRQEISDRLEDIHHATQELERFQSMDARAFRAGKDNVAITSHWLHICLEAILTIESHILSNIPNQETKKGWEQKKKETGQKDNSNPKETKNTKVQQSPSLTRQGILPKDLSQRLKGIKRYRDRMKHEYWKIQPEELLQMTQKGLPDFKEFEKQIRNAFSLGSASSNSFLTNASLLSLLLAVTIIGSFFFLREDPEKAEAALTVNSPTPNNNSITTGLVGHWTFDGPDTDWSSTGTEIKDTSGNGNDGDASTSGMDTTNAVAGKIGQGLYFDGNDQVVEVTADAAFEDLGPLTISAWVYPEASAYKPVYMTGDTNSAFIIDNSNLVFKVSYTGDTLQREGVYNSTILNSWSHIVVTWDGSTTATNIHIYQNGTEVSYNFTQNATGTRYSDSGLSLYIGNDPYGANDFIGVIDDVRVYNRVLSSDEVQVLYNLGH